MDMSYTRIIHIIIIRFNGPELGKMLLFPVSPENGVSYARDEIRGRQQPATPPNSIVFARRPARLGIISNVIDTYREHGIKI